MWQLVRNRMLSGLFVLIPLAVTILILRLILRFVVGVVSPILKAIDPDMAVWMVHACSVVIVLATLLAAGTVASHVAGRRLIGLGEKFVLKLPVIRAIYLAARQLVDTVSSTQQQAFKSVIELNVPGLNSTTLGFVTAEFDDNNRCVVFVPTAPNPMSGYMLFMDRENVKDVDISVEDAIKIVVSAGILAPKLWPEPAN